MAFAQNLRRLRLKRFLSQGELARRSGLHAVTLTRLETGTTAPSARSVRALADALGVEPRELANPNEVAELGRVLRTTQSEPGVSYHTSRSRPRRTPLTEPSRESSPRATRGGHQQVVKLALRSGSAPPARAPAPSVDPRR
jgi:transcriptional regulator with XRE-family HTH domain